MPLSRRNSENCFSPEKVAKFKHVFDMWNLKGDAKIGIKQVIASMKDLGRFDEENLESIMQQVDNNRNGAIDFNEFLTAAWQLHSKGDASGFSKLVSKQIECVNIETSSGGFHSYTKEEVTAFANHLNNCLGDDKHLDYLMPINTDNLDLCTKVSDGVLLCKFLNYIEPNTIDWRAVNYKKGGGLNQFQVIENHNISISAAQSLGLSLSNLAAEELRDAEKNPTLVLGFMWQAIKLELMGHINLKQHPELIRLLNKGEEMHDLLALPPEEILKRWFNYHLEKQKYFMRIENFGSHIRDAKAYTVLLKSIAPDKCNMDSLNWEKEKRANEVLKSAEKIGAKIFIKHLDILAGNEKLNLSFTAQLFNTCHGLEPLKDEEEKKVESCTDDDDEGDSREERTFRMWINALGLGDLHIQNLYEGCHDGLTFLKVVDKIEPGIVKWDKIEMQACNKFKKLANCNYVIVILKQLKLSVVNVGGNDVVERNKKLVLGITWQLMRHHMLKVLSSVSLHGKQVAEKDILEWCNKVVEKVAGKSMCISSFNDQEISKGLFFLHLLSSLERDIVDWKLVKDGKSPEDKLLNARYAISIARKVGAEIFLLAEDIIEVKFKMCLTFSASIMAVSLHKQATK